MAPLSYQLSGVILKHDFYGSHLDSQGKTVDAQLERENFKHAGETLCDIWNHMLIDNYPVEATYVDPEESLPEISEKDLTIDQKWFASHVRSSQYFLQITKCDDRECCKTPRSNIFDLLPHGFFPPPIKLGQTFKHGLHPAQLNDAKAKFTPLLTRLALKIQPNAPGFLQVLFRGIFFCKISENETILSHILILQVPYDFYCPSIHPHLSERTCSQCGMYFPSKKAMEVHSRAMHKSTDIHVPCSRVRPINIIHYRNNEALCIVHDEVGGETADWIDVENLEIDNLDDTNEIEDLPMPF